MSYLLRSLEEVAEEMHLMKLRVRVGGSRWMTLPAASRRAVAKRSWTIAKKSQTWLELKVKLWQRCCLDKVW